MIQSTSIFWTNIPVTVAHHTDVSTCTKQDSVLGNYLASYPGHTPCTQATHPLRTRLVITLYHVCRGRVKQLILSVCHKRDLKYQSNRHFRGFSDSNVDEISCILVYVYLIGAKQFSSLHFQLFFIFGVVHHLIRQ